MLKTGVRVKLKTFNDTVRSKKHVADFEDYWKLIGEIGTICQDPKKQSLYSDFSKKPRVLVKLDKDLNGYGLVAHNNVSNSLWLLISDLEIVD